MLRCNSICEKTATKKMQNKSSCLNSVQGSEWTKYCKKILSKNYCFSKRMPRNLSLHYQECHCTMAGLTSTVEQQVKLNRKTAKLSISSGNRFFLPCLPNHFPIILKSGVWEIQVICQVSQTSKSCILWHLSTSTSGKKTIDSWSLLWKFVFVAALHSTQTVECLLAFHLF